MAVKRNGILEGRLPAELMKVLLALASKWGDVIELSDLKVVHLSGAMTNEVYTISWPTKLQNDQRTVLIRVYGEGVELFFDRNDEIRTFDSVSKCGYGPKLLGQFQGGRVEEFIHARTLSAADLHDPEISSLVAAKMREFHGLNMPGSKSPAIWNRVRNWLREANHLCTIDELKEHNLNLLEKEITLLEFATSSNPQRVGFCHNDLQYGNIMIDDKNKSITLIDYEYASYNPIAFDIANHFCEMAANYHTDTPHVLDYNKYPGLEQRRRFVTEYLGSDGESPITWEVEQMLEDVEKWSLVSHIQWGLWGIISAHVNHIDYDYVQYAKQRFEQYWRRRDRVLLVHEEKNK